MKKLVDHCRPSYNWIDDDTKDYDVGWQVINGSLTNSTTTTIKEEGVKLKNTKWACKNAWCYQVCKF
jgi:hypothetical protein